MASADDEEEPVSPSVMASLDALDVQILRELARGDTVEMIARSIHLSERSVRRRTRHVCEVLGVGKPIEAVVRAVRDGVV